MSRVADEPPLPTAALMPFANPETVASLYSRLLGDRGAAIAVGGDSTAMYLATAIAGWPRGALSSSPLARTTLLTPTPIIRRPVMLLLRSTLSSITCTFIDGVGTGVPFGYVVTADDGISSLRSERGFPN